MKKPTHVLLIVLAALAALVLVGPLLLPVPSLTGTVPPQELADADSRFIDVAGLNVHYRMMGEGSPTLVLLHGFAASTFSWREVMELLSAQATVVAFDRPSSGLTERPMPGDWPAGESPYSRTAQADQTIALMDALGIERAVLVGNSAGGTIAVLTALLHPERVQALVLVDAAIYTEGGAPTWLLPLLATPHMRRIGPLLVRSIQTRGERLLELAWHDPSKITDDVRAGYRQPLRAQNWDRALWELIVAARALDLPAELDQITVPTLVITGDDDRIVPTDESIRLAGEMSNTELVVIPACGHTPQEECPEAFLEAVTGFLEKLTAAD